ncbi:hypothetical protein DFP74_0632 [Nocardiopsis sp. Huas11]|uniref:hypothetical protein n=1 Tax=Nocardiopsis sp. Huas11 TaxID=2183912 RepID=UPI000EAC7D87|nr:hypothetical protein [Nocardiopsis sp. Huas11]RKS05044.1 hypothetical protein DFP74_0632 [Nocardiopsis sp. Huas11]
MPQAEECFALELVERFPPLGKNIDFYYDGPEDFLAHVFFGIEVTREVVAAYVADIGGVSIGGGLDWRGVLGFLNRCLQSGGAAVRTVIGTSFLFQLPTPGHEGYGIVEELDDELARLFESARPNG